MEEDCEYMTEEEFCEVYNLYKYCKCIDDVMFILEWSYDMLAYHMYTQNEPPADYSLMIIAEKLYPFFQKKLRKKIEVDAFKIYSINDHRCWGESHSKEILNTNL